MSKKEKDSSQDKKTAASNDAKAKIKRAEKAGEKQSGKKDKKPAGEAFKSGFDKFKKFWKDFRGELKKIVWPNGRTVLKNTGIVLMTVLIIGAMIWILDFGLSNGMQGLRSLAENTKPSQSASQTVTPVQSTLPANVPETTAPAAATTTAPVTALE